MFFLSNLFSRDSLRQAFCDEKIPPQRGHVIGAVSRHPFYLYSECTETGHVTSRLQSKRCNYEGDVNHLIRNFRDSNHEVTRIEQEEKPQYRRAKLNLMVYKNIKKIKNFTFSKMMIVF